MKYSIIVLCICMLSASGFAESGTLTLEQALEYARTHSPELQAARLNSEAARQGVNAAGMWKNPVLDLEAEGLGWDNDLFSDGEYAVGLIQEFQLGGKQKKERAAAQKAADAAGYASTEAAIDLANEVRRAFIEVLSLQESGKVQAEQEQLGRAFVQVAKRRLDAGGGSELEVVQAELELEKILFSQTCCLGELIAARQKLASLIGMTEPEMGTLEGVYFDLPDLAAPALDHAHPTLKRLDAEVDKLRAEAQFARSRDVSNIKVGAGYRYESESDANSFVMSAMIPLGLHKQGRAVEAAILQKAYAAEAERAEVSRRLSSELAEAHALYNGSKAQALMGQDKLIPKAEQAYELSRAGYENGRFSWLELIAAQQHLADIRIGYIEALKEAHLSHIEVLKLKAEGI